MGSRTYWLRGGVGVFTGRVPFVCGKIKSSNNGSKQKSLIKGSKCSNQSTYSQMVYCPYRSKISANYNLAVTDERQVSTKFAQI
ncbi:MAG: hypothetical protein IPI30_22330 [Saprospiraceae bacterium]|nr:hypothetical protein [Candidatus Vicinibacter affinis]